MIEEEGGNDSSIRDVSSIIPAPTGISAAYIKNHIHTEKQEALYDCSLSM